MNKFNRIYIGVGTNLGDKLKNILNAYQLIHSKIGEIKQKSFIYQTPPWGFESEDEFYNSVIIVATKFNAFETLDLLKSIEKELGRKQKIKIGYTSRIIDLDIIDFNHETIESNKLSIPHLHLHKRNFVLYPLQDVDSDWVCSRSGKTLKTLIEELNPNSIIKRVNF